MNFVTDCIKRCRRLFFIFFYLIITFSHANKLLIFTFFSLQFLSLSYLDKVPQSTRKQKSSTTRKWKNWHYSAWICVFIWEHESSVSQWRWVQGRSKFSTSWRNSLRILRPVKVLHFQKPVNVPINMPRLVSLEVSASEVTSGIDFRLVQFVCGFDTH